MNARRASSVAGLLMLALVAASCTLPDLDEAQPRPLPQTSFLYAADGSLITRMHAGENRVVIPYERIPEVVRDAVVAIEDQRFFQHKGIDLKALVRAAYQDVSQGRIVEGGSTITQQYIKNAYLGSDRTLERKIDEAALAWQLEHRYTKEEILTKYLNTVYFGNGAYGLQAAARTYFSVPAKDLTLTQGALLAGLIAAPVDDDPVKHPERARKRRNLVLDAMLEQGMIDQARRDRALTRDLGLRMRSKDEADPYLAPYFVDYVEQWFLSNPRFGQTQAERYRLLFEGGLRIETTLDPELQRYAEQAVGQVLILRRDPYAAMTVIDPRTGFIVAMVGGRDYFSETDPVAQLNLAAGGQTGRPAGSSFKPFALVAALAAGISPQAIFPASSSTVIPLDNGGVWQPRNYEGSAYGAITMERATINSVNVAYVEIEQAIGGGNIYEGAQKVVDAAKAMGIRCCERTTEPQTGLDPVPSAVLGTNEVNTVEMASAYGTFATGGYHVDPIPVARVTAPDGTVLFQANPKPRLVVDPAVITVANGILQEVVDYGTGTAADIGRPQIGKTGTGQEWRDAWFVGAIPQLTAAVWVGFPQGQISMTYPRVRIPHVLGGTWPTQIWHAFMVRATVHMPVRPFPSSNVQYVSVAVDITQGCLPNRYTPPQNIVTQQFIIGTQPARTCTEPTSYQLLPVPSVIGMKQPRAAAVLQRAGFNVSVKSQLSSQAPGTVIAQYPSAGTQAQQTSTITITVARSSSGSPPPTSGATVPNVLGLGRTAASSALTNAGFDANVVLERECNPSSSHCDYSAGTVWWQSPAGGDKAVTGSTVTIKVNP